MTLAHKRKVIDVLLCTAQDPDGDRFARTTWEIAAMFGHDSNSAIAVVASARWNESRDDYYYVDVDAYHNTVCLEAAYRLIESSPMLRREWFGAS